MIPTMIMAMAVAVAVEPAPIKGEFEFKGMYVEGCSCAPPCPCELTGVAMGCEGVGAFSVTSGKFNGEDISGIRFAYAVAPGDWVACYVDAPTNAKYHAGVAMAETAFAAWGKMLPTKRASISIAQQGGKWTLTVDGGRIMSLTAEPVLGGDGRGPIRISNINSALHPEVFQGKTLSCKYDDNGKSFEISDSNAYFNPRLNVKGVLASP